MPKRFVAVGVMLALILMGVAGPAWALGREMDTGALVVTKLFRGMVNAATGWMEIFKQTSLTWRESGPGIGMSWGLIKGIAYAVARSTAGGYEIATFTLPIPDGYRPIMQPEYVLSDLPGKAPPAKSR